MSIPLSDSNGMSPNGNVAPRRRNGGGFGIANTRERLAAFYGVAFALEIAPNAPTGTVVSIELPFRTSTIAVAHGDAMESPDG